MRDQDLKRGTIRFIERYKQLISYEGMERHRNITPTDIDGFIDYNGQAFFYMECKHKDKYYEEGLDRGQKRAIENSINSHIKAGHKAIAVVFIHEQNAEEIIIAKDKSVVEIYWDNKWSKTDPAWRVIDAIEWFENYCKKRNINI